MSQVLHVFVRRHDSTLFGINSLWNVILFSHGVFFFILNNIHFCDNKILRLFYNTAFVGYIQMYVSVSIFRIVFSLHAFFPFLS